MLNSALSKIEIPSLQRIAVIIEYDGAKYSGWQKQSSPIQETVQEKLEAALSKIADSTIKTYCAGRTDTGVHATTQVVHFETPIDRGAKAWEAGSNSLLPPSIRVICSKPVKNKFHARFSAEARRYHYIIQERNTTSAVLAGKITQSQSILNSEVMNLAAAALIGEQDFSAFRAAGCQSKTAFRNVIRAKIVRQRGFLVFDIIANAFLQHMVRNIVGALLEIGREERKPSWLEGLLAGKDRSLGAVTAPPDGLYLVGVQYPEEFALPSAYVVPPFLSPIPLD